MLLSHIGAFRGVRQTPARQCMFWISHPFRISLLKYSKMTNGQVIASNRSCSNYDQDITYFPESSWRLKQPGAECSLMFVFHLCFWCRQEPPSKTWWCISISSHRVTHWLVLQFISVFPTYDTDWVSMALKNAIESRQTGLQIRICSMHGGPWNGMSLTSILHFCYSAAQQTVTLSPERIESESAVTWVMTRSLAQCRWSLVFGVSGSSLLEAVGIY